MSGKKKPGEAGYVYSTNPDFRIEEPQEEMETLPAAAQRLRIRIETKHRGGKTATLISGFVGRLEDLEDLGRKLKTQCGTGGSVKDGEIIIQGEQKAKVSSWLQSKGYHVK